MNEETVSQIVPQSPSDNSKIIDQAVPDVSLPVPVGGALSYFYRAARKVSARSPITSRVRSGSHSGYRNAITPAGSVNLAPSIRRPHRRQLSVLGVPCSRLETAD